MQKQSFDILDALSKDEQITHLKELASSLKQKIEVLAKDNDALAKDNVFLVKDNVAIKKQADYYKGELSRLIEQIKLANARYFGAKSDHIKPYQVSLFNDMEAVADTSIPEPECSTAPPKARKKECSIDYSKLETTVIEYELPVDDRQCPACNTVMEKMGVEVKHTIRLIPARLVHEEHRRHVYGCKPCSTANATDGQTPAQIVKERCRSCRLRNHVPRLLYWPTSSTRSTHWHGLYIVLLRT